MEAKMMITVRDQLACFIRSSADMETDTKTDIIEMKHDEVGVGR